MSSTQDFTCIFCNETFEDKESLQEHFRKHGDPKFNSIIKNKSRFQYEVSAGNERAEDSEMVGCDVCDETFKSISKAITHKHKVHPDHDAKYFCPWCGKLFTMKHLYNKHMLSSHTSMPEVGESCYHCDSCNVDFFVPSAMVYHNRFFHRQDSELPSIGHSKKVKTFNQELIQIYYCPFCGEEYNNKVNLHKHMADDHNDENQSPEEVLRCPLCDAVFYHLDAYELHLSFHSSDDVYSDDSEMAMSITEFSLESVSPIMEKVEEETKCTETEGIDKFLQLIMDESRESGNNDGLDKPKSKKHKKHKKSKKSAITLDEFLNMNKDVFGDGLDVQGIEEVPTQQVLKKHKGKKDNTPKAMPVSAIAKLKKQGITVKSNSTTNSPTFKTNRNINIKEPNIIPLPMKAPDNNKMVTSNDLLSKLLNQGNNAIKIMKKPTADNVNKNKIFVKEDVQEPATSAIKDVVSYTATEEIDAKNDDNMEQEPHDQPVRDSLIDKKFLHKGDNTNAFDVKSNSTFPAKEDKNTKTASCDVAKSLTYNNNDTNNDNSSRSNLTSDSHDGFQEHSQNEANMNLSDEEHSFETNGDDAETNVSSDESPNNLKNKYTSNLTKVNHDNLRRINNNPLDTLKHFSGQITLKPAYGVQDKVDVSPSKLKTFNETEENTLVKVASNLGKNVQNVSFKQPLSPQKKLDSPTKSIEALKILNKQITISPSVSSTTKSNDESEDEDPDNNSFSRINMANKNIINENDNANFKTPMSIAKQVNTTAILKRLTNVTAKPIIRAANISQDKIHQLGDSRKPVVQQVDTIKKIDQNIEIFNIDDSDSDQDLPDEEYEHKQMVNTSTSKDDKMSKTVHVLKNLSKTVTVKPTQNKNPINVKKNVPSPRLKLSSDEESTNPSGHETNFYVQNKHMNIELNHTLKKLGNNISIKSQYSTPDSQRYQMLHGNDIEDHFDNDDGVKDSEAADKIKITELQEDYENVPSDDDMDQNENVIVQSPNASNSDNEEETHNSYSDEEINDDIETQIKTNTLSKEKPTSKCLDTFKRNNTQLTIKSLTDKNTVIPLGSPLQKQEEVTHNTNNLSKDMFMKQSRASENQDNREVSTKNINESATTSSSNQKVTNQVNTVKTVKTFQSETIIEEITTTVTKTVRTVNQSSKQIAQNMNATSFRPRLMSPNQHAKPLQTMAVRNIQTVGTRVRNPAPPVRLTAVAPIKATGQLVTVRSQNQIVPRMQGMYNPSMPGPSNIKKFTPQLNIKKPVIGKPLKISPLAMNQTVAKRVPETITGNINSNKRSKDSMAPFDAFEDDIDDSILNFASTSSSRSDFCTTATKTVKGKSTTTATQARSEQHSEKHITKLSNMSGLKIVRTSAKQASQVETRSDINAAKRTTMDAIEKLQKQGLLVKKPRIEFPDENEHYNSDSDDGYDQDYEEN